MAAKTTVQSIGKPKKAKKKRPNVHSKKKTSKSKSSKNYRKLYKGQGR